MSVWAMVEDVELEMKDEVDGWEMMIGEGGCTRCCNCDTDDDDEENEVGMSLFAPVEMLKMDGGFVSGVKPPMRSFGGRILDGLAS